MARGDIRRGGVFILVSNILGVSLRIVDSFGEQGGDGLVEFVIVAMLC